MWLIRITYDGGHPYATHLIDAPNDRDGQMAIKKYIYKRWPFILLFDSDYDWSMQGSGSEDGHMRFIDVRFMNPIKMEGLCSN